MILEPECIGCMFNQIYKAIKLLKPDAPRSEIISAQIRLMKYLANTDIINKPGPLIARKTYSIVAEVLGTDDPYKPLKDKYNKIAMEYYDEVKKIVKSSIDPLFEAIAVSALGNTIDFGAIHHDIDLINDIKNFTPENLVINDIPLFKESLKTCNNLLILGDNSGEIVFDRILIEILQELYPNLEIIYSVRAGPIINDATMEDAEFAGLTKIVKVIEAPAAPGIELSIASDEFKYYFLNESEVILSKGQGNFESLYGINMPNKEVYYLLKAKCNLMERIFNVKIGDLIFKKKTKDF